MLVIANHDISDPEHFWAAAEEITKILPSNLKVHSVFPSQDGKFGTCIWEAENVEAVQEFLDKNAGQYAKNFCYGINVEKSMGLPKIELTEALN